MIFLLAPFDDQIGLWLVEKTLKEGRRVPPVNHVMGHYEISSLLQLLVDRV